MKPMPKIDSWIEENPSICLCADCPIPKCPPKGFDLLARKKYRFVPPVDIDSPLVSYGNVVHIKPLPSSVICPMCKRLKQNANEVILNAKANEFKKRSTVTYKYFCELSSHLKQLNRFYDDYCAKPYPWHVPERYAVAEIRHSIPFYKKYYSFPKIIATIDPNNNDRRDIPQLLLMGCRLFHLDIRTGTLEDNEKTLDWISHCVKHYNKKYDRNISYGIIFEMHSGHLITGITVGYSGVLLEKGSEVILTADRRASYRCTNRIIYINFDEYICMMEVNDIIEIEISLSQRIQLKVLTIRCMCLVCEVLNEGILIPKCKVFLSYRFNDPPCMEVFRVCTESKEELMFALTHKCDYLVVPWTKDQSLLKYVIDELAQTKKHMNLVLKLNYGRRLVREEPWDELKTVCDLCTGIWIRNDENQCADAHFDGMIQLDDQICQSIMHCRNTNRTVIFDNHLSLADCCTNVNFGSLRHSLIYPDAICIKRHPVTHEFPFNVHSCLRSFQPDLNEEVFKQFFQLRFCKHLHIRDVFYHGVVTAALQNKAACIITVTNTSSVICISSKRPPIPIIAVCTTDIQCKLLLIWRSVIPIKLCMNYFKGSWEMQLDALIAFGVDYARRQEIIYNNSVPYVVCFDSHSDAPSADCFRVFNRQENWDYYLKI